MTKKIVRKEWLENLVVSETVKNILQPEKIAIISKRCAALSSMDTSQNEELKYLQKQLSETVKSLNNVMAAIEQGIISKSTKSRLAELETAQEKLEFEICQTKQPALFERHIAFMLSQFQRETTDTLEEYNENIIECFVNSVHLFDDHIIITYNLTNDKKTELLRSVLNTLPDKDGYSAVFAGSDIELSGGDEGN